MINFFYYEALRRDWFNESSPRVENFEENFSIQNIDCCLYPFCDGKAIENCYEGDDTSKSLE